MTRLSALPPVRQLAADLGVNLNTIAVAYRGLGEEGLLDPARIGGGGDGTKFPRPKVAQGRYLAGGLLFFARDNPSVLVRSAQGMALNLGHPSTYVWAGYFVGLALLMARMVW